MSDKSVIEWTDATWNSVTGCTKVSPGCALERLELTEFVAGDVVAADVSARTPAAVEASEGLPASTSASNFVIGFVGQASLWVLLPMLHLVMEPRRHEFEVLRSIVRLITVAVVNQLSRLKKPTKFLFHDDAVFIDVAAADRLRMLRSKDLDVAVGGNATTAFPVISWHRLILAGGVLHRKEVMPYV